MTQLKPDSRSGMAIMLVLYIMVIVSFVSAGAYLMFRYSISNTQDYVRSAQLNATADGLERLAQQLLAEDIPALDHAEEKWAEPKEFEFGSGNATLQITDAQGRFNLNNLHYDEGSAAFLSEYMKAVEAPINNIAALQDWLDYGEEVRPAGAESAYYLLQDPPYFAANNIMIDVSELFGTKDADPTLFKRYKEVYVTLPEATPININGIPLERRQNVMQPFAKGNRSMVSDNVINESELQEILGETNPAFSVRSQYFTVSIRATLGDYTLFREILLFRPDNSETFFDIKILSRHNNFRQTARQYEQETF